MPSEPARDGEGRVLGIDPGKVRVGLALSDPLRITAQGLPTFVRGRGSLMEYLAALARDEGVTAVVLGFPLNLDGSEGEAALDARRFAERLERALGLPVVLWDERLSSVAAHRAFPPGSRKDWDRIAAVLILQSYLDSLAGGEA